MEKTNALNVGFASIDDLFLDPLNPRLGRNKISVSLNQGEILELMKDWTLEELATSFIESGEFWLHEALLVVEEKINKSICKVVIEGNRRLAALKLLKETINGNNNNKKWKELIKDREIPPELFNRVPYILLKSRESVVSFLGFRHVTGIKEWRPAEKAQFIASMIHDYGMTYEQVSKKIGSKPSTVRQNYISFRLLLQIEDTTEVPGENIEERFSVMYLSLRTQGVRNYLQIDIKADPESAKRPVPKTHLKALHNFALWLFGDDERIPLFTDSRQVDNFGKILENAKAVEYLERTEEPNFEYALKTAGADESEVIDFVKKANDNLQQALSKAHLYSSSEELISVAEILKKHTKQLIKVLNLPE